MRGPLILLVVAILIHFPSGSGVRAAEKGRWIKGSFQHDGRKRTYRLRLPPSFAGGETIPLVLVLHGGGGTARAMVKLSHFHKVADREGFMAVFPDGFRRHWNDGRIIDDYPAHRQGVDDVGFLSRLISTLTKEWGADPERVYVTGASNGGMMALRLACEVNDRLAAAAPVIAALPLDLSDSCRPARPLPILMINGSEDGLVPWEGGHVRFGRRRIGTILSVPETLSRWVRNNGCLGPVQETDLPDADPGDKTRITRYDYTGCRDGKEVSLLEVNGGGHTWPGGFQYAPRAIVGRTSRDMDAAEVIWDFFSRHRR
ncbi:MAG: dienelactone hydrolase family protein [bacterium]|nr:MAG: dienelactone hydrolase family protein [bacterium]